MGNPPIHRPAATEPPAPYQPGETNGILAQIGAEYIAAGAQQLPKASELESGQPLREVIMDVPGRGLVRLTYQLNTYKHGRSRFWHWATVRADLSQE